MEFGTGTTMAWNFEPGISLLKPSTTNTHTAKELPDLSTTNYDANTSTPPPGSLGDFSEVWKLLASQYAETRASIVHDIPAAAALESASDTDLAPAPKAVKWRDEEAGADLEDNVEPAQDTAASIRTRKRAARRARAREREEEIKQDQKAVEVTTDVESGEELEAVRRSPDRRALIASMLGRPRPTDHSPPTSPSPPKNKATLSTPVKKDWPVSNPFLWSAPVTAISSNKQDIVPLDGLSIRQRTAKLITQLAAAFPEEQKYLNNSGLSLPEFMPMNTSPIGIHVFIDMSNISIGFHDCLKVARGMPVHSRVRRIPFNFHTLALVLERGRPAARRILCGSDRSHAVNQAETLGYEANILDRVHKIKTPTKKRSTPSTNGSGFASASHGETSGSETPFAISSQARWAEQAVDEILHLKMSHSLLDTEKPSTLVLATGDAAEAEYSDGFLRMVERALNKGWMVELVSFKLNTSSLYKRREFRQKWGSMFKWIILDDFVEGLIGDKP